MLCVDWVIIQTIQNIPCHSGHHPEYVQDVLKRMLCTPRIILGYLNMFSYTFQFLLLRIFKCIHNYIYITEYIQNSGIHYIWSAKCSRCRFSVRSRFGNSRTHFALDSARRLSSIKYRLRCFSRSMIELRSSVFCVLMS